MANVPDIAPNPTDATIIIPITRSGIALKILKNILRIPEIKAILKIFFAAINDKGSATINAKNVELMLMVKESKQGLYQDNIFEKSGGNISLRINKKAGTPLIINE